MPRHTPCVLGSKNPHCHSKNRQFAAFLIMVVYILLSAIFSALAAPANAAGPKVTTNLPSSRVSTLGIDTGSNLRDQEIRYDNQFIQNKWSALTHDQVDWPSRVPSDPSTAGKDLQTQNAGEKLKGTRYDHEISPTGILQTHTAQGPDGNLPWQGMATTGPLHDPRPIIRLQDPSYADFRRWSGAAETDRGMSPESVMPAAVARMHSKIQGASEATADGTTEGTGDALKILQMSVINIANEASGTPGDTHQPFRPLSQCIWMVQQVFKQVYIPFALLLLLPGAVLTQARAIAAGGMLNNPGEDISPFSGILRSVIAIFLIPATQLIVSYSIDLGNCLSYEIQNVLGSSSELVNQAGAIEENSRNAVYYGDQAMHLMQNVIDMSLTYGLIVLEAFQIAMMCYLMLMGPMAAAFLAWPGGIGKLFRPVFSNWVDAVFTLSLWHFWWCVITLVMILRIRWLTELGLYDPHSQWEALAFTAFLVMMSYVPFTPFDCKPGDMVDKLMDKAQELTKGTGKTGSVTA